MTKQLLDTIARESKIRLSDYDHVYSFIDENYSYIFIMLSNLQVCGGTRSFHNELTIKKRVSAVLKKVETSNLWPEDYETGGVKWIYELS